MAGFAAISSASVSPFAVAILDSVSPFLITYVTGVGAGVGVGSTEADGDADGVGDPPPLPAVEPHSPRRAGRKNSASAAIPRATAMTAIRGIAGRPTRVRIVG